MLIVHGARDTAVPPEQAAAFAAKLNESGAEVIFCTNPDHGSAHTVATVFLTVYFVVSRAGIWFEKGISPRSIFPASPVSHR